MSLVSVFTLPISMGYSMWAGLCSQVSVLFRTNSSTPKGMNAEL